MVRWIYVFTANKRQVTLMETAGYCVAAGKCVVLDPEPPVSNGQSELCAAEIRSFETN